MSWLGLELGLGLGLGWVRVRVRVRGFISHMVVYEPKQRWEANPNPKPNPNPNQLTGRPTRRAVHQVCTATRRRGG